jgi:hypothetical protein
MTLCAAGLQLCVLSKVFFPNFRRCVGGNEIPAFVCMAVLGFHPSL